MAEMPPHSSPGLNSTEGQSADHASQVISEHPVPTAQPVEAELIPSISPVPLASPVQRLPMPISRLRAIVELVLLVLAGIFGAVVVVLFWRDEFTADPRWFSVASSLGIGVASLLACVLILRVASHKSMTIGWTVREFAANVGIGLAALVPTYLLLFLAGMVFMFFHPEILSEKPAAQKAIEQTVPAASIWWLAMMMVFVAVWEEVVFRGFLLTRLHALLKRWWLVVPLGAMLFGPIHSYEGPLAVCVVAFLALVMGILFVWRKSLVPGIALHLAHNMIVLLMLRAFSKAWN